MFLQYLIFMAFVILLMLLFNALSKICLYLKNIYYGIAFIRLKTNFAEIDTKFNT